jgi:hypothetical protein
MGRDAQPNYETSFISDMGDEDLFFNLGQEQCQCKLTINISVNKKKQRTGTHDSSFSLSVNNEP